MSVRSKQQIGSINFNFYIKNPEYLYSGFFCVGKAVSEQMFLFILHEQMVAPLLKLCIDLANEKEYNGDSYF